MKTKNGIFMCKNSRYIKTIMAKAVMVFELFAVFAVYADVNYKVSTASFFGKNRIKTAVFMGKRRCVLFKTEQMHGVEPQNGFLLAWGKRHTIKTLKLLLCAGKGVIGAEQHALCAVFSYKARHFIIT